MSAVGAVSLARPGSLPADEVIYDKEKGTKTVITYVDDEDEGQIYKETKEYTIETIKVASSIAKRRLWKKFGESKNDPPGPNPANTYPGELVEIQYIQNKLAEESDRLDKEIAKPKQAVTCRTCKGAHFSHQCPNKSDLEAILALQSKFQDPAVAEAEEKARLAAAGPLPVIPDASSGRYIPPALRAGAAPLPMPSRKLLDGYSIRVTNLPENTNEDDLRDIFGRFGQVIRIYPAKNKKTQLNRGFAYISYLTEQEAADAIFTADGMRYGHLILKVDWAQPSNN
ncbi:Eukaryotic translation initiation factor 3 subunit G [Sparganum proliferum]